MHVLYNSLTTVDVLQIRAQLALMTPGQRHAFHRQVAQAQQQFLQQQQLQVCSAPPFVSDRANMIAVLINSYLYLTMLCSLTRWFR
jgi:hypothetical protein